MRYNNNIFSLEWSPTSVLGKPNGMTIYIRQIFLVSLDGQDTRFSPWRPGFDSRTRNISLTYALHTQICVSIFL